MQSSKKAQTPIRMCGNTTVCSSRHHMDAAMLKIQCRASSFRFVHNLELFLVAPKSCRTGYLTPKIGPRVSHCNAVNDTVRVDLKAD